MARDRNQAIAAPSRRTGAGAPTPTTPLEQRVLRLEQGRDGDFVQGQDFRGGKITGTDITASNISGTVSVSGGTITGTSISGGSITGTTIGTVSGGTISGTTITGSNINTTTLTGGMVRTASSGARIEITSGASESIVFFGAGSETGQAFILAVTNTGTPNNGIIMMQSPAVNGKDSATLQLWSEFSNSTVPSASYIYASEHYFKAGATSAYGVVMRKVGNDTHIDLHSPADSGQVALRVPNGTNELQVTDLSGGSWRDIRANSFIVASSQDTKSNIKNLNKGKQAIKSLRPVAYERDGRQMFGLVAEEVAQVAPECVSPDGKGVDVMAVLAMLAKAVQELSNA